MADQQKSIQKPSPDSSADILEPVADAAEPRPRAEDDTRYDPTPVEQKWAAAWESDAYRATRLNRPPAASPSTTSSRCCRTPPARLHMGHVRNYAIGDALARYMWMNGYNVLHPMGWDSFGLPAENAALKHKRQPREWTLHNIAAMKTQMKRLGFGYDWSREITTCLPDYYRWNQWFFLKLFQKGLAYRKKSRSTGARLCATVLANEQVVEGCCWRHEGTPRRAARARAVGAPHYRLLRRVAAGSGQAWKAGPRSVRTMQRNWIGRSEGANVDFTLDGGTGTKINVFTTRIDTIYGATSVQLAPQHPLVAELVGNDPSYTPALRDAGRPEARA